MPPDLPAHTESGARDVLLLRAVEDGGAFPAWSTDDAAWATRLAREGRGGNFLADRAAHALQRLLPRAPELVRLRRASTWHAAWAAAALAIGLLLGLAIDHVGAAQRIDLLAPPVWALVAWNLALGGMALVAVLLRHLRRATPRERLLARWWRQRWADASPGGPTQRYALDWARATGPLMGARAALVMHLAAAGLGLGVAGGLYLRGLVLDYRAGWQSTFLQPATVQALLDTALAPASWASGVPVPPVAALRESPSGPSGGAVSPPGSAAPWLHLYAVTLLLLVIAPRGLLAGWAAWRARRAARCIPLPLHEPYFLRLLAERGGQPLTLRLQPVGCTVPAARAPALRDDLARAWGGPVQIELLEPTNVEAPMASMPAGDHVTRLALFDLAATPEDDVHGRWLDACAAVQPLAGLVLDGHAYAARFAAMPERLAQRRRLWQDFAARRSLRCEFVGLDTSAGR